MFQTLFQTLSHQTDMKISNSLSQINRIPQADKPQKMFQTLFQTLSHQTHLKISNSLSQINRKCCGFGGLLSFSLSIRSVAWFCSMEIDNAMVVGLVWVFCVVGLWWSVVVWFTGSMIIFFLVVGLLVVVWCVVQRWWSGVAGVSFFALIFCGGY